ncbi:MAG: hypothetical protein ACK442_11630 [Novosphingobium sp.]|jgi:hypothetical protein
MVRYSLNSVLCAGALSLLLVASAADARKKKPVAPPPAPPAPAQKWVFVPYKPSPPNNASPNFVTPAVGPDGLHASVNRNISPAQTTWNLRSGYNVAALNCLQPKHAQIVVNYRAFLRTHAKALRAANLKVDSEWRGKYGAGFVRFREKYMTEVYNRFAMPPTLSAFCDAALAMSNDAKAVKVGQLDRFAAVSLPNLEIVFDDFYKRYDQYKADLAAWETKWAGYAPGTHILVPVTSPLAIAEASTPASQPKPLTP